MTFRIQFHDAPAPESIRSECEQTAEGLRSEFPEISKVEIHLSQHNVDHEAHVHVTGKNVDLAASATHREMREAVVEALDRARVQLRKHHDKLIFQKRREVQKGD
jgi:ribosomal subunit interface protein